MNQIIFYCRKNFYLKHFAATFLLSALALFLSACGFISSSENSNNTSNTNVVSVNAGAKQSDKIDSAAGNKSELCANAYNPIGAELKLKYRVIYANNSMPTQEYTESFSDIKLDTFVVKTKFPNIETNINWRCTADGLLATQFDNNSLSTSNGMTAKIETVKSKGVSMPGESRWRTGEKWNAEYVIKQTMQFPNSQMRGEGDGTIKGGGEILGEEQITVSAGAYQAMKVRYLYKFNITVKTSGVTMPVPQISMETTAWYARDVGLVKSVTASNGEVVATTELLSTGGQ